MPMAACVRRTEMTETDAALTLALIILLGPIYLTALVVAVFAIFD